MEDNFKMRVKVTQTGKDLKIILYKSIELNELKSLCIKELREDIPIELIYHGNFLKDTDNLSFLKPNDLLFLMRKSNKIVKSSPVSQINLIVHPSAPKILNQINQGNFQLTENMLNLLSTYNSDPTNEATPVEMLGESLSLISKLGLIPGMRDILANLIKFMYSDQQFREGIINANPQLRGILENNPLLKQMLNSPLMIDLLNNLITSRDIQQSISENNFEELTNILEEQGRIFFESFESQNLSNPSNPEQNLREKYAQELQQIINMGFTDEEAILKALESTNGDVFIAIESQ